MPKVTAEMVRIHYRVGEAFPGAVEVYAWASRLNSIENPSWRLIDNAGQKKALIRKIQSAAANAYPGGVVKLTVDEGGAITSCP